jgi:hypothetical protein
VAAVLGAKRVADPTAPGTNIFPDSDERYDAVRSGRSATERQHEIAACLEGASGAGVTEVKGGSQGDRAKLGRIRHVLGRQELCVGHLLD